MQGAKYKFKIVTALVIGVLVETSGSAQSYIDSLKVLATSCKGECRYDALISLVRAYYYNEAEMALIYAKQAHKSALVLRDSSKIVQSARILGQLLNSVERPKEAEHILTRFISVAARNDLRIDYHKMLSNLAIIYTNRGHYAKALGMYFRVLEIQRQTNDPEFNVTLGNIGLIYYKVENYKKAISYLKECLRIKVQISDQYGVDKNLINLALCYAYKDQLDSCEYFLVRAFHACEGGCTEHVLMERCFAYGVHQQLMVICVAVFVLLPSAPA